jgi:hypothetical protein
MRRPRRPSGSRSSNLPQCREVRCDIWVVCISFGMRRATQVGSSGRSRPYLHRTGAQAVSKAPVSRSSTGLPGPRSRLACGAADLTPGGRRGVQRRQARDGQIFHRSKVGCAKPAARLERLRLKPRRDRQLAGTTGATAALGLRMPDLMERGSKKGWRGVSSEPVLSF